MPWNSSAGKSGPIEKLNGPRTNHEVHEDTKPTRLFESSCLRDLRDEPSARVAISLSTQRQPIREARRQAGRPDPLLRLFDRIRDAKEADFPRLVVQDPIRRARIPVAWLADRSHIYQVPRAALQRHDGFAISGRRIALERLVHRLEAVSYTHLTLPTHSG